MCWNHGDRNYGRTLCVLYGHGIQHPVFLLFFAMVSAKMDSSPAECEKMQKRLKEDTELDARAGLGSGMLGMTEIRRKKAPMKADGERSCFHRERL